MESFGILIGSVARKDFHENSDVDICRINSDLDIKKALDWPNGPINYVDYDEVSFKNLYESGSLFLYHVFFEGKLIYGDLNKWELYRSNFKVKKSFLEEINSILSISSMFKNIEMFGGHYLTLYSNLYTNIKNFSIFYLANQEQFTFNKEESIKKVFGDFYYDLLYDAYNYYERASEKNVWNFNCKETAINITNYYLRKMENLKNDK
jgi:predicted nucleotidyltransferase